jgi:uncharacterized protein
MEDAMPQFATTEAELEAIYGPRATPVATIKEIDHISDHYRLFIDASPFLVVATAGPEGLDCSPRGDTAGFVHVADRHTIMLPDRRGNNRIDTLRNLVRDPRISLLFLIPGIGRTLRINGRAAIRTDAEICDTFKIEGKAPRSVIVATVERAYTQCPRALIRSKLWDPTRYLDEDALPSQGTMMKAIAQSFPAEEWDRTSAQRIRDTMY